jgi:protocatechuate 4,5-dioxygenase beta chain
MAEIVGAFGTPHMPNSPGQVVREGERSEVGQLFGAVREHVDAVNPDVLVVFDTDHFAMWFYDRLPTFAIGVAETTFGPGTDDWPGLVSYDEVPVHEPLARYLHTSGIENGFDFTLTEEFTVDHSIIVPLHFLNGEGQALRMRRPMVPIWVNGIAPPLPRARRCYALGEMVRKAVEAWPSQIRVAAIASGALSGDIGGPRAREGQPAAPPDEAWVRQVVSRMQKGEVNELLNEATQERILQAGNVSGEMLNWIALLGFVGGRTPRFLEQQLSGGNAYGAWRWD